MRRMTGRGGRSRTRWTTPPAKTRTPSACMVKSTSGVDMRLELFDGRFSPRAGTRMNLRTRFLAHLEIKLKGAKETRRVVCNEPATRIGRLASGGGI